MTTNLTSVGRDHPVRAILDSYRREIFPPGHMVDLWRSGASGEPGTQFRIDVSLLDRNASGEEWLVSSVEFWEIDFERALLRQNAEVVDLVVQAMRRAERELWVCRKHEDCRLCPDIGRVCLAQRRSGVRAVGVSCNDASLVPGREPNAESR